ncbi:MAG: deoxyribonuclease IV [Bacilli bacterium]|nr:deoxyribonuclease IV [Bacilli bacterium]
MNNELIIGSHVGFSNNKQLLGSVEEALSYGSNTFMFYTGAPQNTKRNPIRDDYTYEAYKLMKENNIDLAKVVIHAPYIVNLGNLENFDFSVSFLKGEIERASLLGIKNVVLHPGASVSYNRSDSIESIIKGLNLILDNNYNVTICLETMAGKGTEIGVNIEELKNIIDGVKFKDKIGVCLDTCHLNDSGVDLTKFDEYIKDFDKEIGIDYIKVIHINDSKNEIASHKDRHENIGLGTIGFDTLIKIIYDERFKDIPKILETPYVDKLYPPYKYEIEMIRKKEFNDSLLDCIRENQ